MPCVYARVVHATLYTKFELFKVQYCSILVSIKKTYTNFIPVKHMTCVADIYYVCMYVCNVM